MTFIDARLNRDNFWNVMFWVGCSLLLYLSSFFDDVNARIIALILVLIGMSILVKIKAPVTFTEANDFVNSEGEVITKRFPMGFFIFLSIGGGAVIAGRAAEFSALLAVTSFFFVPVSLFILKNCPISMLFHSKVYTATEVNGMKPIEGFYEDRARRQRRDYDDHVRRNR